MTDDERCIHGMAPDFCAYCNTGRRAQEDLRRKNLTLVQRVNARLDSVGHLPPDVLAILLAGRLELTAPPQHESTLREQWHAATGRRLDDEQVTVDDAQRERFGVGCWYWHAKLTFTAADDQADHIERVLGFELKSAGENIWTVSSNSLALFLGSRGLEPRRRQEVTA